MSKGCWRSTVGNDCGGRGGEMDDRERGEETTDEWLSPAVCSG